MTKPELVQFDDVTNVLYGSWVVRKETKDFSLVVLVTEGGPNRSNGQTWQQKAPMLVSQGIGPFLRVSWSKINDILERGEETQL